MPQCGDIIKGKAMSGLERGGGNGLVGEVWRTSLKAGNGTELVIETQVVSTRAPTSYSHPSQMADP